MGVVVGRPSLEGGAVDPAPLEVDAARGRWGGGGPGGGAKRGCCGCCCSAGGGVAVPAS